MASSVVNPLQLDEQLVDLQDHGDMNPETCSLISIGYAGYKTPDLNSKQVHSLLSYLLRHAVNYVCRVVPYFVNLPRITKYWPN